MQKNIYSAFLSSQVFSRFCLHYKTYESSHYITTTTKCFCVEVVSLNRSYHQTFFSPSFQLNVNVMHSVAGALCLNKRFQSRLHSLAFSGRQLFNPCARLNPWEIFEGGLLSCADSPWLINHIFLRNRWDNACENASPKCVKSVKSIKCALVHNCTLYLCSLQVGNAEVLVLRRESI